MKTVKKIPFNPKKKVIWTDEDNTKMVNFLTKEKDKNKNNKGYEGTQWACVAEDVGGFEKKTRSKLESKSMCKSHKQFVSLFFHFLIEFLFLIVKTLASFSWFCS